MTAALFKDIVREIKRTKGRFLSIFLIVAIGVAFYAGIQLSAPTMRKSADTYFDAYELMDLRIVSSYGLDDQDVRAIQRVEGVRAVMPSITQDIMANLNERDFVLKLITMPSSGTLKMNQPRILSGRLPQNSHEIALEGNDMFAYDYAIGDVITLQPKEDEAENFTQKELTIVGTILSPYYLSFDKGTSTLGQGDVDFFGYVSESLFDLDYYTEIFVTLDDVIQLNSYDDAYFDKIKPVVSELSSIGSVEAQRRYEKIRTEAETELDDAQREYDEGVARFEKEMKDAEAKLEQGEQDLLMGVIKLESNKAAVTQTIISSKAQLEILGNLLQQAQSSYESEQESIQEPIRELDQQIAEQQAIADQIYQNHPGLDQEISDLEASGADPQRLSELTALRDERDQAQSNADALRQVRIQMTGSVSSIEQLYQMLQKQYDDQLKTLNDAEQTANTEFDKAQKEIDKGYEELAKGKVQLELERKKAELDLLDAKNQLDEARVLLDEMQEAQWYVLDRNSHYSYRDYQNATKQMEAIGSVFPYFFFLVAALVCLTTMTRMVEEQRQNIGTLKALGYSKISIAMKYLIYAVIASGLGSVLGLIVGVYLFPYVIFTAWNMMYNIPAIQYEIGWGIMLMTAAVAVGVTVVATVAAVYHELMEVTAALMRTKAPKSGKTILLERIPFIWKRLSFTNKVTARNLFRYKNRFYMTILGVAGCSALLVAGFGIRDSISTMVPKQFEEIYQYNISMEADSELSSFELDEQWSKVQKLDSFEKGIVIYQETVRFDGNEKTESARLIVSSQSKELTEMIRLKDPKTHEELILEEGKVIITEKMARMLDLKEGDKLTIQTNSDRFIDLTISAVTENYIGHSIYLSSSSYQKLFGYMPKASSFLIHVDKDNINSLIEYSQNTDEITSVAVFTNTIQSFSDMITSLNTVVLVLLVSAGLLAFVVLYNLNNVNITERLREIATIKVLGFTPKEVSSYINRESLILTFLGALFGLLLGRFLHMFIMGVVEVDQVMFARNILPMSYVTSVIITLMFGLLVSIVMSFKLKEIPMVESLKSVE